VIVIVQHAAVALVQTVEVEVDDDRISMMIAPNVLLN
jgi:hypothetical protein